MKNLISIAAVLVLSSLAFAQETNPTGRTQGQEYTSMDMQKRAGVILEPGLTGEISNSQMTGAGATTLNTVNGYGVSARIAGHFRDIFFAGADVRYSRPQFTDTTTNISSPADQYNIAPVVGVQTPFYGIRFWTSYIPWGELNPQAMNGVDQKFSNPNGFRFGLGGRISAFSLNLEYQRMNYATTTIESGASAGTVTSARLASDSYLLGLSFPFVL